VNKSSVERDWVCARTGETYSVDAGLEDVWLEALNGFEHLYLRSICEGHIDGDTWTSRKCMPILRLSVIPSLTATLRSAGSTLNERISSLFACSPLHTSSTIAHGWSTVGADEYFIHLDAKRDRTSPEMEEWVRDWFSDTITFLQAADAAVADVIQTCDDQQPN